MTPCCHILIIRYQVKKFVHPSLIVATVNRVKLRFDFCASAARRPTTPSLAAWIRCFKNQNGFHSERVGWLRSVQRCGRRGFMDDKLTVIVLSSSETADTGAHRSGRGWLVCSRVGIS